MSQIFKLNRRHLNRLVDIDFESEHPSDAQNKLSKAEMKRYLLRRFKLGNETFFGYHNGEELVAYVTLKKDFPGYKHCEVYWLAVKKRFQKQGFGKRLMTFIENYAKKKGFRKACLYTGQEMADAQEFYKKLGYEKINEFKDFYGFKKGNTTAVLFAKKIE